MLHHRPRNPSSSSRAASPEIVLPCYRGWTVEFVGRRERRHSHSATTWPNDRRRQSQR
ncbi:MAG TPA: hypothetical protein VEC19_10695 [Usitatibacter sp.]|nr:hypothetical protein [Usitatibacter sp.]